VESSTTAHTERGRRKQMIGVVVSNKMEKTAVVAVERRMRHPLYRKIVRRTTKYKVHDATNSSNLGDIVRIVETRPMSREKRWRIAEVLTRGNVAELKPTEVGMTEVAEVTQRPEAPAPVPAPPAETSGEIVVSTAPEPAAEVETLPAAEEETEEEAAPE
jgi:small subunit ribosomal protein S17